MCLNKIAEFLPSSRHAVCVNREMFHLGGASKKSCALSKDNLNLPLNTEDDVERERYRDKRFQ